MSWNENVYMGGSSPAIITITDADENLDSSQIEHIPVFIIVCIVDHKGRLYYAKIIHTPLDLAYVYLAKDFPELHLLNPFVCIHLSP